MSDVSCGSSFGHRYWAANSDDDIGLEGGQATSGQRCDEL